MIDRQENRLAGRAPDSDAEAAGRGGDTGPRECAQTAPDGLTWGQLASGDSPLGSQARQLRFGSQGLLSGRVWSSADFSQWCKLCPALAEQAAMSEVKTRQVHPPSSRRRSVWRPYEGSTRSTRLATSTPFGAGGGA